MIMGAFITIISTMIASLKTTHRSKTGSSSKIALKMHQLLSDLNKEGKTIWRIVDGVLGSYKLKLLLAVTKMKACMTRKVSTPNTPRSNRVMMKTRALNPLSMRSQNVQTFPNAVVFSVEESGMRITTGATESRQAVIESRRAVIET